SSDSGQANTYRRFVGSNGANPPVLRPLVPTIDDPGPNANGRQWANDAFGSHHPGVCQFVFCDGSVKPLPVTIDVTTLELLGRGAEPSRAQLDFFEQKIRPVLAEHCYPCHATSAAKVRGGLLLDSRDGLRRGGTGGPAVVPGDPAASRLFRALRYEDLQMPPAG